MFGLRNLLFGGTQAQLDEAMRARLEAWRRLPAPVLNDAHFRVRYVVVDLASTGLSPESDRLLGIAATGVRNGGIIAPDDALYLDLSGREEGAPGVHEQLLAFLDYVGKAPLVTYHEPYVGAFLQRVFKESLGLDFQPYWIDLAWLLPSMFDEKSHAVRPLDDWLEMFGLGGETGRRDAMANTLLLARLFQMLLVRAQDKEIDTAARLIDESRASSFLRRTH